MPALDHLTPDELDLVARFCAALRLPWRMPADFPDRLAGAVARADPGLADRLRALGPEGWEAVYAFARDHHLQGRRRAGVMTPEFLAARLADALASHGLLRGQDVSRVAEALRQELEVREAVGDLAFR